MDTCEICHHRSHHTTGKTAAEEQRAHQFVAGIDEIAKPIINKLLRQSTCLHVSIHIDLLHLEALMLQHRLNRNDVWMYLAPRQRFYGCIDHIGTIVTYLKDTGH